MTVRFGHLAEDLARRGRPWTTPAEAAELCGVTQKSAANQLERYREAGQFIRPARGFYVVVPLELRGRPVPATLWLDALMTTFSRGWYLGWLSAAALWGASHHAPGRVQIAIDEKLNAPGLKQAGVEMHISPLVGTDAAPVERRAAGTATIVVATRELTAIDIAQWPSRAGGTANAARVLADLGPLDVETLTSLAAFRPASAAQRLGALGARARPDLDLTPLRSGLVPTSEPALLDPRGPRRGPLDREWNVLLNAAAEPDEPEEA